MTAADPAPLPPALPTGATALPAGNDFPDWLSPMLVKELRQGVRTRVFVTMFILLQVAMLMTVSLTLLVAANGGDTAVGTGFFWTVVGLPILFVLPLGNLGSINGEIRANTLELIFLTRLTAFRIVAGKWFASFTQCLLFVCAVLPYLVLRYFIGGVNLTVELTTLGWMLVASAVISAFAMGVSAYPPRVVRGLTGLFILGGLMLLGPAVEVLVRGSSPGAGTGAAVVVGLLCCAGITTALMLEVATARIAPPAENHSAVMRLLAAGGFVVALLASLVSYDSLGITFYAFAVAVVVCTVGLCEQGRWIPSLFRPFALRGWGGRMVGRMLYPGWYTAVPFTVATFAAFGALLRHQKMLGSMSASVWFVALLGALLLPVALVRGFMPKTKRAPIFYVVVCLLSVAAAILAMVCDNALGTKLETPVCCLPLAALIVLMDNRHATDTRFAAVGFTTLASLVLLLIALIRAWGQAHAAEAESLQPAISPPPLSPPVHDAPVA